jgi:RNA polymerase sigma factor (sigma-70 family)
MKDALDYIKLLRDGDQRGLSHIYERWFDTLHKLALGITKEEDPAQEIAQDSFIKIWKQVDKSGFVNDLVVIAWLRTTTRNGALNYLRGKHETSSIDNVEIHSQEENAEEAIIQKETISGVTKFLKYLPTECRRIMEMLFVEGVKAREIASLLKIAISTVKNQKARGLQTIKDIISGKRAPTTNEEASDFAKLVIPEELTKEYLKENLEVIKLIVPKMGTLYKKIIKLYMDDNIEELRSHQIKYRKKDGKPYYSTIFYRTRRRAFNELKTRLLFEKETGEITQPQIEAVIAFIKSMRDTDKIIVSAICEGMTVDEISLSTNLSQRTIRNAGKDICRGLFKIYPHPSLDIPNRPSCLKLKDFFKFHRKNIKKELLNSNSLEISSRKKYTHANPPSNNGIPDVQLS